MAEELKEFLDKIKKLPEDKPDVKEGLGQKQQFKDMKLELDSHPGASFDVDDNDLEIKLKTPDDKKFKTTFKLLYGSSDFDCNRCVFSQTKGNKIIFNMVLPKKGFYKFNIFALPASDSSNSYPCVFTYMIEVKRTPKDACCFPKQYSPWPARGCYLYQPLSLVPNKKEESVKFKVYVPDAKRVAVKAGDEWTHLDKDKGDKDVWEGKVVLKHYWNKNTSVRLNAGWDDDSTSYESLLEYLI